MDLKGLGNRLEYKLKTPSTFHASLIATHSASLPHFFLSFSKFLYSLFSSWNPVFKFCTPPTMGLYCLLLNTTSWWQLESQSKFQIFREHALFCLVRHSSLDQSTAIEAKDISEKMVARDYSYLSGGSGCPEGRILAGKIVLLNSLLSVDGTLNTWLEAREILELLVENISPLASITLPSSWFWPKLIYKNKLINGHLIGIHILFFKETDSMILLSNDYVENLNKHHFFNWRNWFIFSLR